MPFCIYFRRISAFDPYTHGYYKVGGRVGEAFKDCHKFYIFDTIYQHQFEIFVTKCIEMAGKM